MALTHHEHQQLRVVQILQVQQQLVHLIQALTQLVQQPLVELFRYQSLPSRRHE
jgi:cell fate (sporulation/competence/biofilm development) regulator YlbF (YheA/YmcA/DUF963 family)